MSWGQLCVLKAFAPSGGALLLLSPSWLLCSTILSSSFCFFQDVDMMDQNGMTPLMWAAYRTHRCVYFKFCGSKHKDVCVAPFWGEDVVEMFLVKYWLLRNNLACGAGVHSRDSRFCWLQPHTRAHICLICTCMGNNQILVVQWNKSQHYCLDTLKYALFAGILFLCII